MPRDRPLPHCVDVERQLLATLLYLPDLDLLPMVRHDGLQATHFYDPKHHAIFDSLSAVYDSGGVPDLATVGDELIRRGLLHEAVYASESIRPDEIPVARDADIAQRAVIDYARRIHETAGKRTLLQVAGEVAVLAYSAQASLADVITPIRSRLDDIQSQHAASGARTRTWNPVVQTARDLMKKDLPPVRWAVEDLIGEGVTLLAAKPKKGKTVLMLQVSISVALGTIALGHARTTPGDVLYLALEDNERRMQRRLRKLLPEGELHPDRLFFADTWLPLDRGGIDALEDWLDEHPDTCLIVIDTLEHVRPRRQISSGIYADDYAALRDLQRLASRRQVAIVVIHHTSKRNAEDPLDEVSGSTGLTAGVDNILVMRSANGIVELVRRGRDFADDSTIALRGNASTLLWHWEGKADDVHRSEARREILDLLVQCQKKLAPKEIAQELGKPVNRVRQLLFHMKKTHDGGLVEEDGRYGVALVADVSASRMLQLTGSNPDGDAA